MYDRWGLTTETSTDHKNGSAISPVRMEWQCTLANTTAFTVYGTDGDS